MDGLKVCKFGGSSVADSSQIKKVVDIVGSDKYRKVVVVSAPKGVTNNLIGCAQYYNRENEFPNEDFGKIVSIYDEIKTGLGQKDVVDSLLDDLKLRINQKFDDENAYKDNIKSWGEYSNAMIISNYMNKSGLESIFICPKKAGFFVTEEYGNAKVLDETYQNIKNNLKDIDSIIVFPGFFGRTKSGNRAVLSRGGSDMTGSVMAASLDAKVYENWTDIEGIRCADPNIVSDPKKIETLTYKEIRELAYMGFKIFHPHAMLPVMKKDIPINIKCTNNPKDEGTWITDKIEIKKVPITGIASKKGFAVFNIEKMLMDEEIGFGRKLLEIFESYGQSYEHSPSGIDSISVVLDQKKIGYDKAKEIAEKIDEKLDPDSIVVEYDKCLISVVGTGLKRRKGIASKITGAIANSGVNIETLNQGTSELSVIIGIDSKDESKAVNALYDEFFRGN